jgi:hypothetical protein
MNLAFTLVTLKCYAIQFIVFHDSFKNLVGLLCLVVGGNPHATLRTAKITSPLDFR